MSNVLYFKGLWSLPFGKRKTRTEPFNLDGKQSVAAQMMRQRERFQVGEFSDLDARAVKGRYA